MKASNSTPLLRSAIVAAVALAATLALSACLARSAPTPGVPSEPTVAEAVPQEPTEVPEPSEAPEPTEPAEPAAPSGAADLAVSIWRDGEVKAGGHVTYYVAYANYDSERAADGVALRITLPEGAALANAERDGQPVTAARAAGRELEYALGTLQPGEGYELALTVGLPANLAPGSQVALTARIAGAAPDPDEETNYAEDSEAIPAPSVSVGVRPSDECGPFVPGGAVSYLVSFGNSSEAEAPSVAITSTLPAGMSFRSARRVTEEASQAISPQAAGPNLTFQLGTLAPGAYGELLVEIGLDSGLLPDQPLTYTVGIAAPGDLDAGDNWAEDVQYAQVEGPDVWVELESQSDGEVGGALSYLVFCGNRGTQDAEEVVVSLSVPPLLQDVAFSTPPTSYAQGVATWGLGKLAAGEGAEPIEISTTIASAGQATAKATARSRHDVDPRNDVAEAADELLTMHMPAIVGPSAARVGAQPVVFGLGKPGATVSLYVAGAGDQQERPWGKAIVSEEGRWEITPTARLPQPGWYWFMATQELDGRTSPMTGVGNYYTDQLAIDTNSLTVNGERVGGIDQGIDWLGGQEMTFGARIIHCDKPLTPTLQVRYYNLQGLMVNHERIEPKVTRPDGYVEFEFRVPDEGDEVQWQIELGFYCREEMQTSTIARSRGLAAPAAKLSDLWHPECWFGGCNEKDPAPPKPPKQCPGCTPIPRPKPKPQPKDPDGFVYDGVAVQAGARMEQAIVASAWVTCTCQGAEGEFEPWDALEYNQVNPQFTDAKYPDRVLRPGYYSFFVPPGSYRIQVTAPGYLPYVSQTLRVLNDPVTLHIPLKRKGGGGYRRW